MRPLNSKGKDQTNIQFLTFKFKMKISFNYPSFNKSNAWLTIIVFISLSKSIIKNSEFSSAKSTTNANYKIIHSPDSTIVVCSMLDIGCNESNGVSLLVVLLLCRCLFALKNLIYIEIILFSKLNLGDFSMHRIKRFERFACLTSRSFAFSPLFRT